MLHDVSFRKRYAEQQQHAFTEFISIFFADAVCFALFLVYGFCQPLHVADSADDGCSHGKRFFLYPYRDASYRRMQRASARIGWFNHFCISADGAI